MLKKMSFRTVNPYVKVHVNTTWRCSQPNAAAFKFDASPPRRMRAVTDAGQIDQVIHSRDGAPKKATTSTVQNNRNPSWPESDMVCVGHKDDLLILRVFDDRGVVSDSLLGVVVIPMQFTPDMGSGGPAALRFNMPLHSSKGGDHRAHGEIDIQLGYVFSSSDAGTTHRRTSATGSSAHRHSGSGRDSDSAPPSQPVAEARSASGSRTVTPGGWIKLTDSRGREFWTHPNDPRSVRWSNPADQAAADAPPPSFALGIP